MHSRRQQRLKQIRTESSYSLFPFHSKCIIKISWRGRATWNPVWVKKYFRQQIYMQENTKFLKSMLLSRMFSSPSLKNPVRNYDHSKKNIPALLTTLTIIFENRAAWFKLAGRMLLLSNYFTTAASYICHCTSHTQERLAQLHPLNRFN